MPRRREWVQGLWKVRSQHPFLFSGFTWSWWLYPRHWWWGFLPFWQAAYLSSTVTGVYDPPSQIPRPNCHCSAFMWGEGGEWCSGSGNNSGHSSEGELLSIAQGLSANGLQLQSPPHLSCPDPEFKWGSLPCLEEDACWFRAVWSLS